MELTRKQEEGLKIVLDKYHNGERYAVISGYAGTGKSTLINHIVAALPGHRMVGFGCYTGKAASVLTRKGNKNAVTLHRLLYYAKRQPNGTFVFKQRPKLDYDIIIVDEVSMVPQKMIDTLLSYRGIFVIFCGDPAQLSPILESKEDKQNTLLEHPDVFLDEIMRQAAESDIIQMSMKIRNHEKLPSSYEGTDVRIYSKRDIDDAMYLGLMEWGCQNDSQILCATNRTRNSINNTMRSLFGHTGPAQDGDKVVCLHNDWNTYSDEDNPLINGTIGYLHNPYPSFYAYSPYIVDHDIDIIQADLVTDFGDNFSSLIIDKPLLENGNPSLTSQELYKISKRSNPNNPLLIPQTFDYGYAITVWKAQGSQWNKILLFEEEWPKNELRERYLYTGITRAESKVIIIKS